MKLDLLKFLKETGLAEMFYPGKKLVRACHIPGDHKSHAIVYDWTKHDLVHIEVKAGHTGEDLPRKELAKYPASLQTRTFFEIQVADDDGESESEEGSKGKSGGGKGMKKRPEEKRLGLSSFMKAADGQIPTAGELTRMVVMGMEIAAEAYGAVLDAFIAQADKAKITATELLSKAGKFITKYAPPAFMEAKGDFDKAYVYNRERNEPMFGMNLG
ncbi:MAG: hypothetical protein AB7E85_03575 [Pseudobdellovibrionaceae bacterium]